MRKAEKAEEAVAMGFLARREWKKSGGIRCTEDGEEKEDSSCFAEANDR
jgi:hypothetical protein